SGCSTHAPSTIGCPLDLDRLRRNWDQFGKEDPLWAILTIPEKQGGRWDVSEFFATGEREISEALRYLAELGHAPRRLRALDFGCGVGRLTQALALHFQEVVGVDIAPSMIAAADRFNRHGQRCRYVENTLPDLSFFADGSFDFIYSVIALQHMDP